VTPESRISCRRLGRFCSCQVTRHMFSCQHTRSLDQKDNANTCVMQRCKAVLPSSLAMQACAPARMRRRALEVECSNCFGSDWSRMERREFEDGARQGEGAPQVCNYQSQHKRGDAEQVLCVEIGTSGYQQLQHLLAVLHRKVK